MATNIVQIAADYGLTQQATIALVTYVDTGDEAAAARAAGVTEKYVAELIHRNPEAKAALIEEVERRFGAGAVIGYRALVELAKHSESDAVRKDCAKALIERGHGKEPSRVDHYVHRDEADLVERILTLFKELGLSPEALAQMPGGELIDVTPTKVETSVLPPATETDYEDEFLSFPEEPESADACS